MKKSIGSIFHAFALLTVMLSGCAPASTPVPPTLAFTPIPPATDAPVPTAPAPSLPAIDPQANSSGAMYLADLQHSGVYAAAGVQPVGELKWTFATNGAFMSAPAISDGVGYFASSDGNLYAVDIETGQEKWRLKIGHLSTSSPAVAGGLVIIGSLDLNLYAVDAQNGQVRWTFKTKGIIETSAAISAAIVYFTSRDGYLYAVDLQTGQEKWRFNGGSEAGNTSPAIADGIIYVGGHEGEHLSLYAVDLETGLEKWRFVDSDEPIDPIFVHTGTPTVGEGVVVIRRTDYVYAVDLETGQERWKFKTAQSIWCAPAIDNGVVYFGANVATGFFVFGLDSQTGEEVWKFETGDNPLSPSISGSAGYFSSGAGFHAVELSTGNELWNFQGEGAAKALGVDWNCPTPAIADGVVYLASEDGNVYALK